jgi:hypothetical protein
MFVESLVRENPEEKDLLGHTMILHIRESRGHFVDVTTDEVLPAIEKSYREQLKENEPGTFTLTEHNKMVHPLYLLTQYLPGLHHLKERYELKKIIVPAAIYKNRYEEYIKMLGLKLDVDINPNLQTAVDAKLGQDEITKRFITEIQNRITIDPSLPERVLLYGRTAVNAEIKDFARDRGFTTLAWENLTPLGQARVVRSAKEIIWTADAEIGNVVFTTPQTKIIQITNNIQNNPIKGIVSQLSKLFNKPWQFHLLPNESGSIPKIEEALD